jgi:hypothetical protein
LAVSNCHPPLLTTVAYGGRYRFRVQDKYSTPTKLLDATMAASKGMRIADASLELELPVALALAPAVDADDAALEPTDNVAPDAEVALSIRSPTSLRVVW